MKRRYYLSALAILLSAACCLWAIVHILPTPAISILSQMLFPAPGCAAKLQPPAGFESDLVGTWQTLDPDNLDTLILREDHRYKQIVHRVRSQYYAAADYESDWQPWWVEHNSKSLPYLHLQGMHTCISHPLLSCDKPGNGGADPCISAFVYAQNQGILMIVRRLPQDRLGGSASIVLELVIDSEGVETYVKRGP